MGETRQRALARQLADAVSAPADAEGRRLVMERLTALSGNEWLRLDEAARRQYWVRPSWVLSPLAEIDDWAPLTAPGAAPIGLIAASMWRDGRVRQAAVTRLAAVPEPAAAAALAVRVADRVPEVRSAAVATLATRSGPLDVAAIVAVLLAGRHRQHGRHAAGEYLAGLAAGNAATLQALTAPSVGRACRVWALEALSARRLLTPGELTGRALRDHDPVVALWCAQQLAAPDGELGDGGRQLLSSARAGVRAFAVGRVSDPLLSRVIMESLLLDRSGAVRSMARWRWKRLHQDPAPVYRAALQAATQPYQVAAALSGLDEDSDASLPGAAVPFLAHPSPAVRCAAVRAIGRHSTGSHRSSLLVPLLQDPSGKVAAVTVRQLRGYAVPPQVLAILEGSGSVRARRVALALRQQHGPWDRVRADLAALNDPGLADDALRDLLGWLQHGAATSYGRPSPGHAAAIADLLHTERLTVKQRREIAFATGIR